MKWYDRDRLVRRGGASSRIFPVGGAPPGRTPSPPRSLLLGASRSPGRPALTTAPTTPPTAYLGASRPSTSA